MPTHDIDSLYSLQKHDKKYNIIRWKQPYDNHSANKQLNNNPNRLKSMLSEKDLQQLAAKGISPEKLEHQLEEFKTGFPFLKLEGPAAIGKGIIAPSADDVNKYVKIWNEYKEGQRKIVKFVPASGAASRMFKDMFAFADADYDVPTTDFEKTYFANIEKFAFYNALDALLKQKVSEKVDGYAKKFGVKYDISFSEQKPSTDTVAANPDGTPFRNEDGSLLFRPGGHGALIENLNEIDADVIFVKNIDNVVPDRLKPETTEWKQVIAGILISLQKKAFGYLELLDSGNYTHDQLVEIARFVKNDLCCVKSDLKELEDAELVIYLKKKLNRPMRVAGVVKNVGEPGGGPFLAYNQDGTYSLQILESSQIDKKNETYMKYFTEGTHFNPVDLVCATKDYKGNAFNLPDYVDRTTGFISQKSKNGKDLQALELPGLWNGAMSDWNTIFVEVPLGTFNPVKTVNDLLREQHQ